MNEALQALSEWLGELIAALRPGTRWSGWLVGAAAPGAPMLWVVLRLGSACAGLSGSHHGQQLGGGRSL